MARQVTVASLVFIAGAVITLVNLRGGLRLSFPLVLGLLLLADGVLRFLLLPRTSSEFKVPRSKSERQL